MNLTSLVGKYSREILFTGVLGSSIMAPILVEARPPPKKPIEQQVVDEFEESAVLSGYGDEAKREIRKAAREKIKQYTLHRYNDDHERYSELPKVTYVGDIGAYIYLTEVGEGPLVGHYEKKKRIRVKYDVSRRFVRGCGEKIISEKFPDIEKGKKESRIREEKSKKEFKKAMYHIKKGLEE